MTKRNNSKGMRKSHLTWRTFIIIIILLCTQQLFSQDRINIELGMGYPFPDKKFFIYYDGIFSINSSITYQVANKLYTGISFNLVKTKQDYPEVFTRYYVPAGIINYKQNITGRLFISPELGLGMLIMSLKCSEYDYHEKQLGLDINGKLALGYSLNNLFDIMIFYRFDYMYLQKDEGFTMLEYYRNMHLSCLGASVNFKF